MNSSGRISLLSFDPYLSTPQILTPKSSLALSKLGILQSDLLYKPITKFNEPGLSEQFITRRYLVYNEKREDRLKRSIIQREQLILEENDKINEINDKYKNQIPAFMDYEDLDRLKEKSTNALYNVIKYEKNKIIKERDNEIYTAKMIELQKSKEFKRKNELQKKTKSRRTAVFRKPVDIIKQNEEVEKLKLNLLKSDQILKNKLDKKATERRIAIEEKRKVEVAKFAERKKRIQEEKANNKVKNEENKSVFSRPQSARLPPTSNGQENTLILNKKLLVEAKILLEQSKKEYVQTLKEKAEVEKKKQMEQQKKEEAEKRKEKSLMYQHKLEKMKKYTMIKEQVSELARIQLEKDSKLRQDKLNAKILQEKLNRITKKVLNRVPLLNIPNNSYTSNEAIDDKRILIETKDETIKDRLAQKKAFLASKSENLRIERFKQSEKMKEWHRQKEWEEQSEKKIDEATYLRRKLMLERNKLKQTSQENCNTLKRIAGEINRVGHFEDKRLDPVREKAEKQLENIYNKMHNILSAVTPRTTTSRPVTARPMLSPSNAINLSYIAVVSDKLVTGDNFADFKDIDKNEQTYLESSFDQVIYDTKPNSPLTKTSNITNNLIKTALGNAIISNAIDSKTSVVVNENNILKPEEDSYTFEEGSISYDDN